MVPKKRARKSNNLSFPRAFPQANKVSAFRVLHQLSEMLKILDRNKRIWIEHGKFNSMPIQYIGTINLITCLTHLIDDFVRPSDPQTKNTLWLSLAGTFVKDFTFHKLYFCFGKCNNCSRVMRSTLKKNRTIAMKCYLELLDASLTYLGIIQ